MSTIDERPELGDLTITVPGRLRRELGKCLAKQRVNAFGYPLAPDPDRLRIAADLIDPDDQDHMDGPTEPVRPFWLDHPAYSRFACLSNPADMLGVRLVAADDALVVTGNDLGEFGPVVVLGKDARRAVAAKLLEGLGAPAGVAPIPLPPLTADQRKVIEGSGHEEFGDLDGDILVVENGRRETGDLYCRTSDLGVYLDLDTQRQLASLLLANITKHEGEG